MITCGRASGRERSRFRLLQAKHGSDGPRRVQQEGKFLVAVLIILEFDWIHGPVVCASTFADGKYNGCELCLVIRD